MIDAYNLPRLLAELGRTFHREGARSPRLIGILFAPPQTKLAKEEIIPSLNYFHHRSKDDIDFFCAGYGGYLSREIFPDMQPVGEKHGEVGEIPWYFSEQSYVELITTFERETKWHYSGEVDLLLADANFDLGSDEASIDFTHVVLFSLDQMIRDGAIRSVRQLFEEIFRAARERSSLTASEFSDRQGLRILGRSIFDGVIEAIPKAAALTWNRGKHFRVIDFSSSV